MKIQLAGIHVNDPKEAFKFYTEVLGFKEKLYNPEANLAIVVSPEDLGGTSLLLEPNDNSIAREYQESLYNGGIPPIVFSVENLAKEYQRLVDLGVDFVKTPVKTDWGMEAIFDDTCGNLIQLMEA